MEHQKKLDELERKKAEDIKKQIMREKKSRDDLLKEEYIRKRIENLKEKKPIKKWKTNATKKMKKKFKLL